MYQRDRLSIDSTHSVATGELIVPELACAVTQEIVKAVREYSKWRANHMHESSSDQKFLRNLTLEDRKLSAQIVSWCRDNGQHLPDLLKILAREARLTFCAQRQELRQNEEKQFDPILQNIEHELMRLAEKLGKVRGRVECSDEATTLKSEILNRIEELKTKEYPQLFERYPFLTERLTMIVELGEIQGEQKYIHAWRTATRIHDHLRKEKFDLIQDELTPLAIDDRQLVNEVYKELYKVSLLTGLEESFTELKNRRDASKIELTRPQTYINFISITFQSIRTLRRWMRLGSTLRSALEDRYGAEAGIVTVGISRMKNLISSLRPRREKSVSDLIKESWNELKGLRSDGAKSFQAFLKVERDRLELEGKIKPSEKLGVIQSVRLFFRSLMKLDEVIISGLERSEKSKLIRVLSDDRLSAAADSLALSLSQVEGSILKKLNSFLGIPGRAEAILGTLKTLSTEELQQLDKHFGALHGKQMGVRDLKQGFLKYLSGSLQTECLAILEGDEATAAAARLYGAMRRGRSALISALATETELDSESLIHVGQRFQELYGQDLKWKKRYEKLAPVYKDWIDSLLKGDKIHAAAARMDAALNHNSGEWIGESFYAHGNEFNNQLIESFEDRPRSHKRKLSIHRRTRGTDRDFFDEVRMCEGMEEVDILRSLISNGELSEAEQLRHCMLGKTKNVQGILSLLSGKTEYEQLQLSLNYSTRFQVFSPTPTRITRAFIAAMTAISPRDISSFTYLRVKALMRKELYVGRDLDRDLKKTLCGHKLFDALSLRKGLPTKAEDILLRLEERISHEKSGLFSSLFNKTAPAKRISVSHQELEKFYLESCINNKPTVDTINKLRTRVRTIEHDLAELRSLKESRGLLVANIGSVGTVLGASLMMGASLSNYFIVAPTAFVVSLSARVTTKSLVKGKGYGRREIILDTYLAAIDGAICGIGGVLKTVQGMYLAKSLLSTRGIVLFGVTSLAKGQMKARLHKIGLGAFTRRYRELGTGHALRVMQLEEEREERMTGKRITTAISQYHDNIASDALDVAYIREITRTALRMQFQDRVDTYGRGFNYKSSEA